MGPIKKKGARSFWGENKKIRKNRWVAPPGESKTC